MQEKRDIFTKAKLDQILREAGLEAVYLNDSDALSIWAPYINGQAIKNSVELMKYRNSNIGKRS